MIRRINLLGGPGSGKSTLAAGVFHELKTRDANVELVTEKDIKVWAYEKHEIQSFDQLHVFSQQLQSEDVFLRNGVQFIVTDAPLYLMCLYSDRNKFVCSDQMWQIAKNFDEQYPSWNIVLERIVPYRQRGRYETQEQAIEFDEFVSNELTKAKIPYDIAPPEEIVKMIMDTPL